MTDLDVLRERLERLADPSPAPDPIGVYRLASESVAGRPRHRRGALIAIAVAATIGLLVGVAVWRNSTDWHRVAVKPDVPHEPTGLPTLRVPGNEVRAITVAFDKIWVATTNEANLVTTMSVYDHETGERVGEVTTVDGEAIWGDTYTFASTDHALWFRTSSGGPSIGEGLHASADNVIYRIDPDTLVAQPNRYLQGDGPLAGYGDRIVAADFSHLEIVREDGVEFAVPSTEQVVGDTPGTFPGTNGLGWLFFDERGMWVVHQGRSLVIRLDPDTGLPLGSAHYGVAASQSATAPTPGEPVWWFGVDPPTFDGSDGAALQGVRLDADGAAVTALPFAGVFFAQIDEHRVVLHDLQGAAQLDIVSGVRTQIPVPRDAITHGVVTDRGDHYLAISTYGDESVVEFIPLD